MTQYRVFEFEADDSTFALNNRHLEIVRAGLYAGFDAVLSAGLTLNLAHTISGVSTVDANVLNTPPKGVFLTKQGVTIKEDAAINIPITVGNTEPRIDLIVAEHSYVEITGGQPAIYSVIKGTPATAPIVPALTNEKKQTIIGQIYIPANMSGLDDPLAFYTKSPTPDFGGNNHTEQISELDSKTLKKESNLFDVDDKSASRSNLDVYSKAEVKEYKRNDHELEITIPTATATITLNYTDAEAISLICSDAIDLTISFSNLPDGYTAKLKITKDVDKLIFFNGINGTVDGPMIGRDVLMYNIYNIGGVIILSQINTQYKYNLSSTDLSATTHDIVDFEYFSIDINQNVAVITALFSMTVTSAGGGDGGTVIISGFPVEPRNGNDRIALNGACIYSTITASQVSFLNNNSLYIQWNGTDVPVGQTVVVSISGSYVIKVN